MLTARMLIGTLLCALALSSCSADIQSQTPLASQTPERTVSAVEEPTITPQPSTTPFPTVTPRPTRTPRPSPTVPAGAEFTCLPEDGLRQSGVVAGVVDGDTIRVQVGLQNFTVRYIGVDTPETNIEPPEAFGPEATSRNRDLVTGERVTLVGDPGVGDTDRYNRLLRYVIVDDIFVNADLIKEGFGRYSASPGAACGAVMFAAEEEARASGAGLWSP